MSEQPKDEFIPVNQVLNLKPRLGPVPGEQVIPWSIIFLVSYIFCQGMLGLSLAEHRLSGGLGCGHLVVCNGRFELEVPD